MKKIVEKKQIIRKPRSKARVDKYTVLPLWSELVKQRAHYVCEVCGKQKGLNSHHIIGKGNKALRYDVRNGCCLCITHHTWGNESAHLNALWFSKWLKEHRAEDVAYLKKREKKIVKWDLDYVLKQGELLKEMSTKDVLDI